MSAIPTLTEDEACTACGQNPRLSGVRSTWCRECKNRWQREYRAGIRRFQPVSDPIEDADGCLIWQGYVRPNGYGAQRGGYPHRIAWERVYGPIPPGLTIDHLCNVRLCVNVAHMELVTRGENTRRANRRRTPTCRRHGPKDRRTPKGKPYCSTCMRESNARRKARA